MRPLVSPTGEIRRSILTGVVLWSAVVSAATLVTFITIIMVCLGI